MSFVCECITADFYFRGNIRLTLEFNPTGNFVNGAFEYSATYDNGIEIITYLIQWIPDLESWILYDSNTLPENGYQLLDVLISDCPIGEFTALAPSLYSQVVTYECIALCRPIQDRTQREYVSVQLPVIYQEQDRGFKMCCDCPMTVLADGSTDSFKNDVTSAWIKLSDSSDAASFILLKDDEPTNYVPSVYSFVNEPNAYYTTIPWKDVLAQEGVGCYTLLVKYNIAGIEGDFMWGMYKLLPYSIQNALKTARLRVKFNLNQQVEGINFTGSNVEDTIRFYGFIGERQPNTEIDNLIYQDRTVKSVVRENLDTYIITTDPLQECVIRPLTDLYLLSENELFISDYNAHNHSYRIQDIPVILEESPEIDYLDIWQRRAKLTAKVGLKSKNRRTFY